MKEHAITSKFTIYENPDELDNSDKNLLLKSFEAKKNSYAPYSEFSVGVSLLT